MLGDAVAAASDPLRITIAVLYAQPVMAAGLVAISVGNELVIRHPAGHIQSAWIAVIIGGPALFLAGRATFGHVVFSRVFLFWVIGALVLAVISPVMILAPPLLAALAAAVILAVVVNVARIRLRQPLQPRPGKLP